MKTLYESILSNLNQTNESIISNTGIGRSEVFKNKIITFIDLYQSGTKGSEIEKPLNDLWKEYGLEIPGCIWWFTRNNGIIYAPKAKFPAEVVGLIKDGEDFRISIHNRAGIDESIKNIALDVSDKWATIIKLASMKLTDAFMYKYDKKMRKVLNMNPDEENDKYFTGVYTIKGKKITEY